MLEQLIELRKYRKCLFRDGLSKIEKLLKILLTRFQNADESDLNRESVAGNGDVGRDVAALSGTNREFLYVRFLLSSHSFFLFLARTFRCTRLCRGMIRETQSVRNRHILTKNIFLAQPHYRGRSNRRGCQTWFFCGRKLTWFHDNIQSLEKFGSKLRIDVVSLRYGLTYTQ